MAFTHSDAIWRHCWLAIRTTKTLFFRSAFGARTMELTLMTLKLHMPQTTTKRCTSGHFHSDSAGPLNFVEDHITIYLNNDWLFHRTSDLRFDSLPRQAVFCSKMLSQTPIIHRSHIDSASSKLFFLFIHWRLVLRLNCLTYKC